MNITSKMFHWSFIAWGIAALMFLCCPACTPKRENLSDFGIEKGMRYADVAAILGKPKAGPIDFGYATIIDDQGTSKTVDAVGYEWDGIAVIFKDDRVTGSIISHSR